jgi:hypothetical protein
VTESIVLFAIIVTLSPRSVPSSLLGFSQGLMMVVALSSALDKLR